MSHPSEYAGNKTGYSCLRAAFYNYVDFFNATLELLKTQGCIRSTPEENKSLGFLS
jgi:hypothetical protein